MTDAFFGDEPAPYDQVIIPLSGGTKLSARLWRPQGATARVPVVLEWIPYRQSDATAVGDSMVHGYFALNGLASIRVDIRGSGNSDGLLVDEYTRQEQDDACEVIAWLAAQPWCNGRVGMIGISWGGFAGLQVAARRPPALKAVITCCSTDDRYRDDVHFMGGALLADGLQWGSGLLLQLGRPPDPAHVGDRWMEMWQHRLDDLSPPLHAWLSHMERDAFWKHGSVCEDYSAIQCPVYAVGGWTDGYCDAVLRLMEKLEAPRKGLIGPWTHIYPNWGTPGPAIGFLQECMRWWRQWLLDEETGIMEEPALRMWLGRDLRPHPRDLQIDGRWMTVPQWPCEAATQCLHLGDRHLVPEPSGVTAPVRVDTPQTLGIMGGEWCPLDGGGNGPEFQGDNRHDDVASVCYDSGPLATPLDLVGPARLQLDVSLEGPVATLTVRLNEVTPDGISARITFAVRRIRRPEGVDAGQRFSCEIDLKSVAYSFSPGNRIRVAFSTTYWPMVWPEHGQAAVTIHPESAVLILPGLPAQTAFDPPAFGPPSCARPIASEEITQGATVRTVTWDIATGNTELTSLSTRPTRKLGDLTMGGRGKHQYRISSHDGGSCQASFESTQFYRRAEWDVLTSVRSDLSWIDGKLFLTSTMKAHHNGNSFFEREWKSYFLY